MRRKLTWIVVAALFACVIIQELSQPAGERTWNGRLFGLVPYDLRPPTPRRLAASYWAPENPQIFTQRFGIGWGVNVGRLVALARGQGRRAPA